MTNRLITDARTQAEDHFAETSSAARLFGAGVGEGIGWSTGRMFLRAADMAENRAEMLERGEDPLQPLSKMEFELSGLKRNGIKWREGMTRVEAETLADSVDRRVRREAIVNDYTGNWKTMTLLAGTFAGNILDPVNFIPIGGAYLRSRGMLGNAARLAGKSGIKSAYTTAAMMDAGLSIAATDPFIIQQKREEGEDVEWDEMLYDVMAGATMGAGLGYAMGSAASRGVSKADTDRAENAVFHALAELDDGADFAGADPMGRVERMKDSASKLWTSFRERVKRKRKGKDVEHFSDPEYIHTYAIDGEHPTSRKIQETFEVIDVGTLPEIGPLTRSETKNGLDLMKAAKDLLDDVFSSKVAGDIAASARTASTATISRVRKGLEKLKKRFEDARPKADFDTEMGGPTPREEDFGITEPLARRQESGPKDVQDEAFYSGGSGSDFTAFPKELGGVTPRESDFGATEHLALRNEKAFGDILERASPREPDMRDASVRDDAPTLTWHQEQQLRIAGNKRKNDAKARAKAEQLIRQRIAELEKKMDPRQVEADNRARAEAKSREAEKARLKKELAKLQKEEPVETVPAILRERNFIRLLSETLDALDVAEARLMRTREAGLPRKGKAGNVYAARQLLTKVAKYKDVVLVWDNVRKRAKLLNIKKEPEAMREARYTLLGKDMRDMPAVVQLYERHKLGAGEEAGKKGLSKWSSSELWDEYRERYRSQYSAEHIDPEDAGFAYQHYTNEEGVRNSIHAAERVKVERRSLQEGDFIFAEAYGKERMVEITKRTKTGFSGATAEGLPVHVRDGSYVQYAHEMQDIIRGEDGRRALDSDMMGLIETVKAKEKELGRGLTSDEYYKLQEDLAKRGKSPQFPTAAQARKMGSSVRYSARNAVYSETAMKLREMDARQLENFRDHIFDQQEARWLSLERRGLREEVELAYYGTPERLTKNKPEVIWSEVLRLKGLDEIERLTNEALERASKAEDGFDPDPDPYRALAESNRILGHFGPSTMAPRKVNAKVLTMEEAQARMGMDDKTLAENMNKVLDDYYATNEQYVRDADETLAREMDDLEETRNAFNDTLDTVFKEC